MCVCVCVCVCVCMICDIYDISHKSYGISDGTADILGAPFMSLDIILHHHLGVLPPIPRANICISLL